MPELNHDQLVNQLDKFAHHLAPLKRIMDAGFLHQRCETLATEMESDSEHYLWRQVRNFPDRLL
jgi:hypothetical protein